MVRKIHRLILLLLLPAPLCVEAKVIRYDDEKMTWQDAQTYCREKHDDLVTVEDEEDNQEIFNFDGWIGLHLENDEWKWSATGTTATYLPWKSGEPQSDKHCVYKKDEKLEWSTDDCSSEREYICSGETMIVVQEKKTWEEALQHCRSLKAIDASRPATDYQNHLYDLVSLLTYNDHIDAQKIAQRATTDEVWTGLRFLAGSWMWLGGEKVQDSTLPQCPAANLCGTLGRVAINGTREGTAMREETFICKY